MVTFSVIIAGILGNLTGNAVFVIIPPLAAIAAGFASSSAGFSANLIIANTDAVLSGISTEAAQSVDPNAIVTPVDNWYFMAASTIFHAMIGTWITERIFEPKLGPNRGKYRKH